MRSRNGRADGAEEGSRAGPWSGRARVGARQGEEYGPPRVHDDPDDAAVARHGEVVDRSANAQLVGGAVVRSKDQELVGTVEDGHTLSGDEAPSVHERRRPLGGAVRTDRRERGLIQQIERPVRRERDVPNAAGNARQRLRVGDGEAVRALVGDGRREPGGLVDRQRAKLGKTGKLKWIQA